MALPALPPSVVRVLPVVAVLVANAAWGTSYAASARLLETLSPSTLTFWKCLIAGLALLPSAWPSVPRLTVRDVAGLVITGAFAMAAATLLQNTGLRHTLSANAALIYATEPFFGVLLAVVVLSESTTWRTWVGLALALLGVLLLEGSSGAPLELGRHFILGNGAILLSSALFALYNVLVKVQSKRLSASALTSLPFLVAALVLLPLVERPVLPRSATDGLELAWLALGAEGGAYLTWNWGVARMPVSRAAISLCTQPLIGGLSGALLRGERLPAMFWLSTCLVVSALLVAVERRAPAR